MKNWIKWLIKVGVRRSIIPVILVEKLLFFSKLGYWPNFNNPQSLSEKLHVRKLNETDRSLVELSDKYLVRKYVVNRVGGKYLIPLHYVGSKLAPKKLMALGNNLVVKRNDDSGSTFLVGHNDKETAESICRQINRRKNYGRSTNEWWYREIDSKILIEKRLTEKGEVCPVDYKFFMFETDGRKYMFVETIRRRSDGKQECGFFDENLNPLEFEGKPIQYSGCLPFSGQFPAAESFDEMKQVALKLSEGINFIRVDLYAIEGKVYFGEMTFCPSEGRSCITPVAFDFELGRRWEKPVLLEQSPHLMNFEKLVCNNGSYSP